MQRFRFSWHKQSVMNFQTSDDPSPADLVADDEVLRRLRREPALIEVLWTKYAQRVFRYLSRRVGHAAAEDLLWRKKLRNAYESAGAGGSVHYLLFIYTPFRAVGPVFQANQG